MVPSLSVGRSLTRPGEPPDKPSERITPRRSLDRGRPIGTAAPHPLDAGPLYGRSISIILFLVIALSGFNEATIATQRVRGFDYIFTIPTARELRPLARSGDADAQYFLGLCYVNGEGDVSRNFKKAMLWLSRASEQGHPGAQYDLGMMYLRGEATAPDFQQALNWFYKGAARGYEKAQLYVGKIYASGKGPTQDLVQAYLWLSLSASRGDLQATEDLERIRPQMDEKSIREAEDLIRSWKPSLDKWKASEAFENLFGGRVPR